jgi:bifunctional non-homologous end joining protein LigD
MRSRHIAMTWTARVPSLLPFATMRPPTPESLLERTFPPMLATLVEALPPGQPEEAWTLELKYDGFRALAAVSDGKVAMWTRNGLDLCGRFPTVAAALEKIRAPEVVIDGEIVVLDDAGVSRFQLLAGGEGSTAVLFVFDLLWLDGKDARSLPLEERRHLLEKLLKKPPRGVLLSERITGSSTEALARVAAAGHEGLIAKRNGSIYAPKRSRDWLKLKAHAGQELAIVGFTPNKGHAGMVGALLLAYAESGKLHFAGKVGTGMGAKLSRELFERLGRDAVDGPRVEGAPRVRDATWVQPKLVAEVQFTEWTKDKRLRHPSFQGLRPDKKPLDCVIEKKS